jgi:hypothetical protein
MKKRLVSKKTRPEAVQKKYRFFELLHVYMGGIYIALALFGSLIGLAGIAGDWLPKVFSISGWNQFSSAVGAAMLASIIGGSLAITFGILGRKKPAATVFISHPSVDRKLAVHLADLLAQHNIRCLLPHRELLVGDDIASKMKDLVSISDAVVLLITSHSPSSLAANTELSMVTESKKRILPILTASESRIPEKLKNLHYVHFDDSNPEMVSNLARAIRASRKLRTEGELP